jgi:acyl-CoA thioester hydrolase
MTTVAPIAPRTDLSAPPNVWTTRVRFVEVDLARVAHHSHYWQWCEESRFHFAEHVLGITREEITVMDVFMPVISCRCDYVSPARCGDRVAITVQLERLRTAAAVFHHEVTAQHDGSRLATVMTKHVFTDENLRLRLTVPQFIRERYDVALAKWPSVFRDSGDVRR